MYIHVYEDIKLYCMGCVSVSQAKQSMEKGKHKLEGENETLQLDLRDIRAAYAEGDKRRKTAEAQLSESQAKNTEDTGKIQDITAQNDKLKVRVYICTLAETRPAHWGDFHFFTSRPV